MYADKLFNLIILGLVKYLSTWQMDWVSFRVEHHFTLTCLQDCSLSVVHLNGMNP